MGFETLQRFNFSIRGNHAADDATLHGSRTYRYYVSARHEGGEQHYSESDARCPQQPTVATKKANTVCSRRHVEVSQVE